MHLLIKKRQLVNSKLEKLRDDPAAMREDRREWLAITEPIFAERQKIKQLIDEERAILSRLICLCLSEIANLCVAGQCAQAHALAVIALTLESGMYSSDGLVLSEVKERLDRYFNEFNVHSVQAAELEEILREAIIHEQQAV